MRQFFTRKRLSLSLIRVIIVASCRPANINLLEDMLKHGTSIPRSIRLAQLQHLLHKNPKGLTSHELARLCGVCVRTIQRDLLDLQTDLNVPITQNGNRYGILGSYTLPPVFFSLYEAMALFLASRLALRQTDENNPHMQQALANEDSLSFFGE
jgi:predicted DNA-binding transcriptional regulator YafY